MNDLTADIIMICKGRFKTGKSIKQGSYFGNCTSHKQNIAIYMAERCMVPVNEYTESDINGVIIDAAKDYIDGIKVSSIFIDEVIREYCSYNNCFFPKKIDIFEAICAAFATVKVKNGQEYVNGFTDKNIRDVIIE